MSTETPIYNIQRSTFLQAVERVLPAVGEANVEGADSVVFSEGWAHSYRADMSISAEIKDFAPVDIAPLSIAVNAKKLAAIVKKLKADVIEVSRTDTAMVLKCGTFTGELIAQPDTLSHAIASLNLPQIQWSEVPSGLSTAIALCRLENHREKWPVVYFSEDLVIAVTGSRWNYGKVHGDPMPTFAIHTDTAKALLSLGDLVHYSVGDLWAHFHTENGAIFSAKVQDSAFPAKVVLKTLEEVENGSPKFKTDLPKDLAEVVDRVAVFADVDQKTSTPQVEVFIAGNTIKLKAKNSGGTASDKCTLNETLPDGVEATFLASVPYLQEAAKKVQTISVDEITRTIEGRAVTLPRLIFRGEAFTQIVSVAVRV